MLVINFNSFMYRMLFSDFYAGDIKDPLYTKNEKCLYNLEGVLGDIDGSPTGRCPFRIRQPGRGDGASSLSESSAITGHTLSEHVPTNRAHFIIAHSIDSLKYDYQDFASRNNLQKFQPQITQLLHNSSFALLRSLEGLMRTSHNSSPASSSRTATRWIEGVRSCLQNMMETSLAKEHFFCICVNSHDLGKVTGAGSLDFDPVHVLDQLDKLGFWSFLTLRAERGHRKRSPIKRNSIGMFPANYREVLEKSRDRPPDWIPQRTPPKPDRKRSHSQATTTLGESYLTDAENDDYSEEATVAEDEDEDKAEDEYENESSFDDEYLAASSNVVVVASSPADKIETKPFWKSIFCCGE
eukprot:TRINITY_DN7258_c0_g1_i1.p1 TRINITY_DN7258_c0_g1~~TRINITY_DN7258_c0_g1_i1.p1  ORF type:complete len:354 (+),score=47.10 TRINITY_DN7258_c0_g1_i1:511-1572(+)